MSARAATNDFDAFAFVIVMGLATAPAEMCSRSAATNGAGQFAEFEDRGSFHSMGRSQPAQYSRSAAKQIVTVFAGE